MTSARPFIFNTKRVTEIDAALWDAHFKLVHCREGGPDPYLKLPISKEVAYKGSHVASNASPMKVAQNAMLPCCIVSLLKVKENGHALLTILKSLSNVRLKSQEMVRGISLLSKATLVFADEAPFL